MTPPYGQIKDAQKSAWKTHDASWDIKIPTPSLLDEYFRVIRPAGRLILFSREPYTCELRNYKVAGMPVTSPVVWIKSEGGNPLFAKKALLHKYEDLTVWTKSSYSYDVALKTRKWATQIKRHVEKGARLVEKELGVTGIQHFFDVSGKQFRIPREPVYKTLVEVYHLDKLDGFMSYQEMKEDFAQAKPIFNLEGKNSKSDVLQFKSARNTVHPTQKPVDLLKYLIRTYTNKGMTVLDNCMGSGSTGVACKELDRNFIGMELDDHYFEVAKKRIDSCSQQTSLLAQ